MRTALAHLRHRKGVSRSLIWSVHMGALTWERWYLGRGSHIGVLTCYSSYVPIRRRVRVDVPHRVLPLNSHLTSGNRPRTIAKTTGGIKHPVTVESLSVDDGRLCGRRGLERKSTFSKASSGRLFMLGRETNEIYFYTSGHAKMSFCTSSENCGTYDCGLERSGRRCQTPRQSTVSNNQVRSEYNYFQYLLISCLIYSTGFHTKCIYSSGRCSQTLVCGAVVPLLLRLVRHCKYPEKNA
jgi:hypothetical protein